MNENKLAIVIATNPQLEEVGIASISGRIVEVSDIDKYYSVSNCSQIHLKESKNYLNAVEMETGNSYIIRTDWLDFTHPDISIEQTINVYKNKLSNVKENFAATIDSNTDSQNETYNAYLTLIAEFIRELKELKSFNKK